MINQKQLLLLGTFVLLGLFLSLPWSHGWTDPVIEGKALWAIQAPKNESGIEGVIVFSTKIITADDGTSYVCGSMTGGKISFGDITVYTDISVGSGFVLALDPNGVEMFVIVVNSTGEAACQGLTLVSDGFYFSGFFTGNLSGDFASQFPGSELKDIPEGSDPTTRGFFVKYHTNGTVFANSFNVLGSVGHFTEVVALGSDRNDNVYLVGNFDGDMTVGTGTLETNGSSGYYAKFFDGQFLQTQVFGGNGTTSASGIATNAAGYSCIIGTSTDTSTIGNVTLNSAPHKSVYFQQLHPDGTQLWFDSMLAENTFPSAVDIDNRRACTFAGPFVKFLVRSNNERIEVPEIGSFFVKYRPDGNNAVFETTRGDNQDFFLGLSCSDCTGTCYVAGYYVRNITFQGTTYSNDTDFVQYFVAKYDIDGNFLGLINGTGVAVGSSVSFKNDNLWATGIFVRSLTLDNFELFSVADISMFTIRYT